MLEGKDNLVLKGKGEKEDKSQDHMKEATKIGEKETEVVAEVGIEVEEEEAKIDTMTNIKVTEEERKRVEEENLKDLILEAEATLTEAVMIGKIGRGEIEIHQRIVKTAHIEKANQRIKKKLQEN